MPLDTNLNVTPYWDDYDEIKNFHRILFRPGVAVQARELTQLQSILQNQIERFGDNLYKKGTIIQGLNIVPDFNYKYIKITDTQGDGQPVAMALYSNTLVVQESSNLQSIVINYKTGFVSQDPNLNTLYIKYLNTGNAAEKVYTAGQTVKVFDRDRTVEGITIVVGGSGYSNTDKIVFTGGGGSGATAVITTDAVGEIVDVSITSRGSGYTTTPNVSITYANGSGSGTGSSAALTARNYIAELVISTTANSIGTGVGVRVQDGVIYQKGFFVRVAAQEEVVEKYSTIADDKVIGFYIDESFVNSNSDSSLLDLATGTPNYSAPGANRLKLTPTIAVVNTATAAANTDFLTLLEFQDGYVVKDNTDTKFNSIDRELARRTYDESGNYVVDTFPLDTEDISGNTTFFNLLVGGGTAYIEGHRVKLENFIRTPVRKASTTANSSSQNINVSYGNYVLVDELLGHFDIKFGSIVNLRNAAGDDVSDNAGGTPSTPGTLIGTARIRSLTYDSGIPGTPTAQYKVYLYDIKMSTGRSFKDVRSLSVGSTVVADLVLEGGNAVLKDVENSIFIFNSGAKAVKQLHSEKFYFRTSSNAQFDSSGNSTILFSGSNTIPYGAGALSDTQKEDFIVIPQSTFRITANNDGTVSITGSANVILEGTSTSFLTDYEAGDYITIANSSGTSVRRIVSIATDTALTLANTVATADYTGNGQHFTTFADNVPIDFRKSTRSITVNSSTSLTLSIGAQINTTPDFTVYHDMQYSTVAPKAKTVGVYYVKLSTDAIRANLNGPWCIGISDVLKLEGVFIGSSNTYSDATTNYISQFELESGQKDDYYGLSYLSRSPGSALSLSSGNCLLLKVKAFTHGTGGYISTESYPVDDTTVPLPDDKVRTQDIPVYVSSTFGGIFSLRDSIDFRPKVDNNANLSSTIAGASIDPSSTEAFNSNEKFFPSPTRTFQCIIEAYLKRVDRIVIDTAGNIRVLPGIPGVNPTVPQREARTMDLGLLNVAPYPSLSSKAAITSKRFDLKNTVTPLQTRRYTMQDIRDIENRIQRLEYYTLLNTLEANAATTAIPSEACSAIEVFKNGFIVDSFDSYNIANINDGEFKALIETERSVLKPLEENYSIDLVFDSVASACSTVQKTGDLVTLPYTEVTYIEQPIANRERSLHTDQYSFRGTMTVTPRVDNFFDTDVTASSVIDTNIADPIIDLVNAQNEISRSVASSRLLGQTQSVTSQTTTSGFVDTTTYTQTTTNIIEDVTSAINIAPVVTSRKELGNYLTSAYINPYIRAQRIGLLVTGLRPGARHYVFFDNTNVTNYSIPCEVDGYSNLKPSDFSPLFNSGTSPVITANSSGQVAVLVDLPGNTFITGEKEFLVMDADALISESAASSKARGSFSAFSLKGSSTNLSQSTRTFDLSGGGFTSSTFTTSRTTTSSSTWNTVVDNTPIIQTVNVPVYVEVPTIQTVYVDVEVPAPEPPSLGWWTGDGGGGGDPLGQTFYVQSLGGSENVLITSIDLYFKQKANSNIMLEMREVSDTGYLTSKVLPFGRVRKRSSDVIVSNNSFNATTFTFESPILLEANKEYGFIVFADDFSPDYRIWTAETGVADILNPNRINNKAWNQGTMSYSTSGRNYTAVQNEDVKFKLKRAEFSSTTGTAVFKNADYEFLTINSVSGSFTGGELVGQMANSYLNVQLTTNTDSRDIFTNTSLIATLSSNDSVLIVYGTANSISTANVKVVGTSVTNAGATTTAFDTEYANGDFIKIGTEVRMVTNVASATALSVDAPFNASITDQQHWSVTPQFDVLKVIDRSSLSIRVNKPPRYSTNSTSLIVSSIQRVVSGSVKYYNAANNNLHLIESTAANSTFLTRVSNSTYFAYLVGDNSQALAKVTSIDNLQATSFIPFINTLQVPSTNFNFYSTFTTTSGKTTKFYSLAGKSKIDIGENALFKSKSNEIDGTVIKKSYFAGLTMTSPRNVVSPIIDISPSSIIINRNIINNDYSNENTRFGNSSCKYVTRRLELADGLEAEDIKVYLKAYRPNGTNIKVYAKILSNVDTELFNDKDWSELSMVTSDSIVSSSLSEKNLREYEYTFKKSPASFEITGSFASSANDSLVGSGSMLRASFNANSAVANSTDIISITSNKFKLGEYLRYIVDSGNTALTALANNAQYYVVYSDATGIKLSNTAGGAAINLTSGVDQTGHNLYSLYPGDLVKITVDTETNFEIIPVTAVPSATAANLAFSTSFNSTVLKVEQITKPKEAFKYNKNSNIVRYYDSNKAAQDTYKFIAVKVLLLTSNESFVPEVDDIRVICVSV